MSDSQSRIFPLVNRRAPVLDRIRNGREKDHGGEKAGRLMAKNLTEYSPDEATKQTENFLVGFVEGLADELEVPESAIKDQIPSELYDVIADSDEKDVFTQEALKEYDLHDTDTTLGRFTKKVEDSLEEDEEEEEPDFDAEE